MSNYDWPEQFRKTYDAATQRYNKGERDPQRLFSKSELEFLASIGCSAQELFDFIDDLAKPMRCCVRKSCGRQLLRGLAIKRLELC